jgi:hypothetical protein
MSFFAANSQLLVGKALEGRSSEQFPASEVVVTELQGVYRVFLGRYNQGPLVLDHSKSA